MCVLSFRMCKYAYGLRFSFVDVLHTLYKCLYGDIVIANINNVPTLYSYRSLCDTFLHVIVLICDLYIYCRYSRLWAVYTWMHAHAKDLFLPLHASQRQGKTTCGGGCTSSEFNIDWWTVVQLATWLKCFIIILLLVLHKARKWNEHLWRSLRKFRILVSLI